MASQIAFQDNMVQIKIKTERDAPLSFCTESQSSLSSLKLSGRVTSSDRFHHTRQQMIFERETAQGKEVMA